MASVPEFIWDGHLKIGNDTARMLLALPTPTGEKALRAYILYFFTGVEEPRSNAVEAIWPTLKGEADRIKHSAIAGRARQKQRRQSDSQRRPEPAAHEECPDETPFAELQPFDQGSMVILKRYQDRYLVVDESGEQFYVRPK